MELPQGNAHKGRSNLVQRTNQCASGAHLKLALRAASGRFNVLAPLIDVPVLIDVSRNPGAVHVELAGIDC